MDRVSRLDVKDKVQSLSEEVANAVTHGIGAALSIAGLTLLVVLAIVSGDGWSIVGVSIFGASMVFLYLASTLYHAIQTPAVKQFFHRMDHIGIAFLIAGTYTPILLIKMRDPQGWLLLTIIWVLALIAAGIKIFFTNRYRVISTSVYLVMGWLAIILARPLVDALGWNGILWMVAGGVAYSIGVIPFLWNRLPYNHAVWHVFVMAGTAFHYGAIALHVVPVR
jgi:hemolysin III